MKRTVIAGMVAALATSSYAVELQITVENPLGAGNFSITPVWVAAHDGNFDTYDGGALAAGFGGITEIAEEGDTSVLMTRFANEGVGVDATLVSTTGAPPFTPGESETFTFETGDPTVNRYFSYASMVVPSNDLFIGNGNPLAIELFNAAGEFQGPIVIEVLGSMVNDNGTEVNDASAGAAFSSNGGVGVDESNPVSNFFADAGAEAYLDSFLNSGTADGGTITDTFGRDDVIARITIVPEPASLALLSLLGLAIRRR